MQSEDAVACDRGGAAEAHLARVQGIHETDLRDGFGRVVLPFALAEKYPNAALSWQWQFVFPAARICRHAGWDPPTRYHLHESAVQRAVTRCGGQV